jgi:protoporphyrinogen oxidase
VRKEHIVVLGAGPAGISAAWHLSTLGYSVTVLEKDGAVGGMGKTIALGNYAVDYGPHTFHIRETPESRAVIDAIRPFFGEDPLILTRGTRVLLRGKYYVYPLEMLQVLTGVSPLLSARIIFDYAVATLKSALSPPRREHSFAILAAPSTICASGCTRRGCGACRPRRSPRSRRSAWPS